jgi:hypothetical protein
MALQRNYLFLEMCCAQNVKGMDLSMFISSVLQISF